MKETFDLDKIGKRMPYRTPDDFFDKMEENVPCEHLRSKIWFKTHEVSKNGQKYNVTPFWLLMLLLLP